MKKILALILAVMMLGAAFGALAEEDRMAPLFATVGEALEAAGERTIAGGEEGYYSVVTEMDGKYFRSVAETDDRYRELQDAALEAELDEMEAAFAAVDEYVKTLPIAYSEEFTAAPMDQAEIDALVGKTIGELREAGYEDVESGTEGDEIVYVMRNGLYEYSCTVDADFDAYEKATEEWPDGGNDFVIRSAELRGITGEACFVRFHADGTVDEIPDPFAGYGALIADVMEMIGRIQNGEEVDIEGFFGGLKEKFPDLADTVDMYGALLRQLGADALATMLTPAD